MSRRIQVFKGILWFIVGLAAATTIVRFTRGLGTTTALSDTTPWGLWVGFDVMGGVALAAGGFVVAAIAHIFQRRKYHHAARPAILTAMLGYAAVAVGLLYDLGLPWNIWRPTVYWNPHSPLFEVAWCVMLYLTVLVLEFSPVFFERTRFSRLYRFLLRLQLPLIILGIMLSTLHQSSLGSLLLIMPFRLHELWYTSLLPEIFFVSAICLGLAMSIFESSLTAWLYERKPHKEMLEGLSRFAVGALSFYLGFRIFDLWRQDKIAAAFDGTREGGLFLFEITLSCILPLIVFSIPALRRVPGLLFGAAGICVSGFLLNRINASGLAQIWSTGSNYFPTWTEFSVSFGIVAGFALIFFFIHEHFPVEPDFKDEEDQFKKLQLFELPHFDHVSRVWLGDSNFCPRRVYSFLFFTAMALGFTMTPWNTLVESSPVTRARGGQELLKIGYPIGTVDFPHKAHVDRIGTQQCFVCHHLHKPADEGTPCSECHADMYLETRIFDHGQHIALLATGNASCTACHAEGQPHMGATAKACSECHQKDMMTANSQVREFTHLDAPGLRKSLHELCIACHEREAKRVELKRPDLFRCATCHRTPLDHREQQRRMRASETLVSFRQGSVTIP